MSEKTSIFLALASAFLMLAGRSPAQTAINLDQTHGDLRVLGRTSDDELGTSVATGDVNGDGLPDMILGAPGEFGKNRKGAVYVVFGTARRTAATDIDLSIAAADLTIIGSKIDDRFGFAVAAGDVNGDTLTDLIMAARFGDPPGRTDAGVVYLVYGARNFAPNLVIDLGTTPADLTILGENAQDYLGASLEGRGLATGDINSDGKDDIVMAAAWADPGGINRAGKVSVLFGSNTFPANHTINLAVSSADLVFLGKATTDELGQAVAGGDVNGDGTDDLLFSAWGADVGNRNKAGEVYLFYGGPGWTSGIVLDLNVTNADLTLRGEATNYMTGNQLGSGDINNDGKDDILIGASFASPNLQQLETGRAYVIFGSNTFPANHVIDLTTGADIKILGQARGDRLGSALAAGDVNLDGAADLIIGAMKADEGGRLGAGKLYTIFGTATFPANQVIDLSTTAANVTIIGDDATDALGVSVASADFDGNGLGDYLIGASGADHPGRTDAGEAILVSGICPVTLPAIMTLLPNVPDANQPPATTLPSTNPVNYCAPMAAVNVLAYWDAISGHNNARGVTAGLPLDEAAEYVGYFMDTNDTGSPDRVNGRTQPASTGTYVADELIGVFEFIRWDSSHSFATPPPSLPPAKKGHDWTIAMDSTQAFPLVKSEIDAGRPVKIDFFHWNPVPTGAIVIDPATEDTIHIFQWGPPRATSTEQNEDAPFEEWNFEEGLQGIGHAVTGMGYIENWRPGCPLLKPGDYVIVHDNWSITPRHVALPWANWNVTITFDPTPPPQAICRFIPKVPDENQPPPSGSSNWCAPVAAGNIVEYWDTVMGHPGAKGVMNGWTGGQASDEIGWFMNTNNTGSTNRTNPIPHAGTFNADIEPGLDEFVQWNATATFGHVAPPATKQGYQWGYVTDYTQSLAFYKSEIDNARPALLAFLYWNPIKTTLPPVKDASGEEIIIYTWGNFTSSSSDPIEDWNAQEDSLNIGHVVTGVGYWENFDPDGPGTKFQPSTWIIVHDNWQSTARNIAIPWAHWVATVAVKIMYPTSVPSEAGLISEFALHQNYPNPFNPSTTIEFTIPRSHHVTLKMFNLLGKEVAILVNQKYVAGRYKVDWDASGFESGIYFYQLHAGEFVQTRRLILIR